MPENLSPIWEGLVARPTFDEYSQKYADYFAMTRRNGIIELRMHTDGGPFKYTQAGHNAWGQAWQEVGNDPENEVVIITGTGDRWMWADPAYFDKPAHERHPDESAKGFYDSNKLLENLLFSVEVPTIAAIQAPGAHTEFALASDITLCSEEAAVFDPHFLTGVAPGDGQGTTLQEILGTKRAGYYLYTSYQIDARTALKLGLVNEVLPRESLLPRAWEIAASIMRRPKNARRSTHAIVARRWQRRLLQDFEIGHAQEAWAIRADRRRAKSGGHSIEPIDGAHSDYPL